MTRGQRRRDAPTPVPAPPQQEKPPTPPKPAPFAETGKARKRTFGPWIFTAMGVLAGFKGLRGTALEYLESILPTDIHDRLWPLIAGGRSAARTKRSGNQVLADLLQSHQSIEMNLAAGRLEASMKREAGKDRATYAMFNYNKPPDPKPPTKSVHWFKMAYNRNVP